MKQPTISTTSNVTISFDTYQQAQTALAVLRAAFGYTCTPAENQYSTQKGSIKLTEVYESDLPRLRGVVEALAPLLPEEAKASDGQ